MVRVRAMLLTFLAFPASLASAGSASATFPGLNGAMAFGRGNHIWTIQPDGTQTNLGRGIQPAWSPDGTRIAYVRERRNGRATIWVMQADGSGKVRVTSKHRSYWEPSWHPNGTELVVSGRVPHTYNDELFSVTVVAPIPRPVVLTDIPEDPHHPQWSPDGSRIAFTAFNPLGSVGVFRVGVIDADGSDYRLLTPATDAFDFEPDWSPDSRTLVFSSNRHHPGISDYDVYSLPATGGPVTRVTFGEAAATNRYPAWSPDGTRILYVHDPEGAGAVTLRVAALNGASMQRICRVSRFVPYPAWQSVSV